jgi:hypothetical protein
LNWGLGCSLVVQCLPSMPETLVRFQHPKLNWNNYLDFLKKLSYWCQKWTVSVNVCVNNWTAPFIQWVLMTPQFVYMHMHWHTHLSMGLIWTCSSQWRLSFKLITLESFSSDAAITQSICFVFPQTCYPVYFLVLLNKVIYKFLWVL